MKKFDQTAGRPSSAFGTEGLAVAVLQHLSTAVIAVDCDGRLVYANQAGQDLLTGGTDLELHHGRIVAPRSEDRDDLSRAIALAAACGKTVCTRPLDMGAVEILVRPIQAYKLALIVSADAPLGLLQIESLRRVFGLTLAESELAIQLMGGRTVSETASESRISVNTARSHLRAIMAKTNTTRQSALFRTLRSFLAFIS